MWTFFTENPKTHFMQNCLKFFRSDRLRLSIKRNWTTLWYCFLLVCYNKPYYSFKIFLRFWLAKIPRKIHQNQLLSTKFGRISPYWIDDVNRAAKLTDYRTVNQEDLGTSLSQVTWCFRGQINEKICNTSNGGQSKRNGNLIVIKKCNVWVWTKFTSLLFAVRTSTVVTEFKKWSFLLNEDNSKLWAGGKVLHFLLFRTKNSTTISSELAFFSSLFWLLRNHVTLP